SPTLLIRAHDFFRRFFAGRMGWGGTRTRTRYFQAPIRADAKWTVHGTEEGEGLCPCAHGYEMRDAAGGPPWVRSKAVPVRLHQRRVMEARAMEAPGRYYSILIPASQS